jgi:hypothetical protein
MDNQINNFRPDPQKSNLTGRVIDQVRKEQNPKGRNKVIIIVTINIFIFIVAGFIFFLLRQKQMNQGAKKELHLDTFSTSLLDNQPTISPKAAIPTTSSFSNNNQAILPPNIVSNLWVFVYAEEGVYKWDAQTKEKQYIISNADQVVLHPDNRQIGYVRYTEEAVDNFWEAESKLYVYDIYTNQEKETITFNGPIRGIEWSPSGNHLAANFGTGPVGSSEIYTYPNGKKVVTIGSIVAGFDWIGEQAAVASVAQYVSTPRPWGGGEGIGIEYYPLNGEPKRILFQSTDLIDYQLSRVKNNSIYYIKAEVEKTTDWSNQDKQKATNWIYNLENGKTVINDGLNDEQSVSRWDVESLLKEDLQPRSYVTNVSAHPNDPDWVIFVLDYDGGGSIFKNQIMIMQLSNPHETLFEISQGAYFYLVVPET